MRYGIRPVPEAEANARSSRLAADTGSVARECEGRRPQLERRAEVLVLELEQHRAGWPPAEAHTLEERAGVGAETGSELVAEAHLEPQRLAELVAEARGLQPAGSGAEASAHGE